MTKGLLANADNLFYFLGSLYIENYTPILHLTVQKTW